ncbi:Rho guanine nucleotide exchange factor 2, partial [Lonchura striata]
MTGKTKGKDKERMKEGKEKDARYTNGHLFTTISVSGMTMCFACNKSITAKEALVCPTCNVTIHNRCKDTLPNCTKVKQKVSAGTGAAGSEGRGCGNPSGTREDSDASEDGDG